MKKGNFILGVVVGVLIMAILGAGFYLGTKFVAKGDDKKDTETKEEAPKEDPSVFKEVSLSDALVKEASMTNATNFCGGPVYTFTKEDVTVDKLSAEVKMNMAFGRYTSEIVALTDTGKAFEVDEKDLEKYFKDLSFLEKYKNGKDFSFAVPAVGKYKNGKFVFTPYATGCIGAYEGYNTELSSARKNDKQLILTYNYFYQTYDYDKDELKVYKAKGDKAPEEIVKYDEETERYKIEKDVYQKYEFVFDISEGNLQLESINYVK